MRPPLQTAEVAPTILALQEHLEIVCQTELERIFRRQVSFRSEQRDALEELTRAIVTTILHGPVTVLEAASTDKETAALLSMVHRIFNLGEKPAESPQRDRQGH